MQPIQAAPRESSYKLWPFQVKLGTLVIQSDLFGMVKWPLLRVKYG